MPTLSLKLGQGVQIGPDIRVTVSDIRTGRASLRMTIPPDMAFVRTDNQGRTRHPFEQVQTALRIKNALTSTPV